MHADNLVIMDGATLSCAEVAAVGGLAFYGRTTGVGANGGVTVAPGNGHGLRLLRSHAGGAGEQVSAGIARGALAIRLNQLAARAGRAGRQRAVTPSGDRLRAVYDRCLQRLPADDDDHPLDVDVDAAEQVIADLAQERAG